MDLIEIQNPKKITFDPVVIIPIVIGVIVITGISYFFSSTPSVKQEELMS